MDEGLNSFLDSVAGYEWDPEMPWTRSVPRDLVSYMVSNDQQPIMTQSDSITNLGSNAYGKPADRAALRNQDNLTQGAITPDRAENTEQRILNAQSADEILSILRSEQS